MTVLVNSFSAEYGGSTGSAVNIVTRSGGNRLRGEVLEVWRPAATEAALSGFTSDQRGQRQRPDQQYSGGRATCRSEAPWATTRRTHFFAAGEFTREDRASPVISPIAPGSYEGHYRGWLGFSASTGS